MPSKPKQKTDGNDGDNLGLDVEFNNEIETLTKAQAEMKMELRNPITQLGNLKNRLTRSMNRAEDRRAGCRDKVGDLDKFSEEEREAYNNMMSCYYNLKDERNNQKFTKEQINTLKSQVLMEFKNTNTTRNLFSCN